MNHANWRQYLYASIGIGLTFCFLYRPNAYAPDRTAGTRIAITTTSTTTTIPPTTTTTQPKPIHASRAQTIFSLSEKLDRIAMCESHKNAAAVSRSGKYRGAWQWDLSTWHGAGETGDPIDYDYEYQKAVAARMYAARGPRPWPICGYR